MLNRYIVRNKKKKIYKNKPQTIKIMAIGTYISIITLNVNGLNASTKRHRLAEWIQKQDPPLCMRSKRNTLGLKHIYTES